MSAAADARDHLGRDLTLSSTHLVCRAEQIRSAAALMLDAVSEIGKGSDEQAVKDAAEAVQATVHRVVQLALECQHESGRMLLAASVRELIEEERAEDAA